MSDSKHDITTPSGRILFALEAMREVEAHPEAEVKMSSFRLKDGDICFMCTGGAARAKLEGWDYGNIPDDKQVEVDLFEVTIDDARLGKIGEYFYFLEMDRDAGLRFNRSISIYHPHDTKPFYRDMEKLAADLKAAGY